MTQADHRALYRKYRSKSLDTVVGQEHITTTLAHALKSGKLAHAYLFTGPRGVGKTSIARILAHEINGLPYEDDSPHLDIIEIDAASNRRIDEIRELRDKINVAPAMAKYKVYIIDEVHMLTREAFNALLKTLEEPPAHAVFILATTEAHKLPETIVSRTQRFMFKPVEQSQVIGHLRMIAEREQIDCNDEALALIAAHGEGSFRDSISLLDQTRGHAGTVDGDYVRRLTGQPPDEAIAAICNDLKHHQAARLVQQLAGLREQGFAAGQVAKRLGQALRADLLQGGAADNIFSLLQKLLEVPAAHNPEGYLELVLLEHALAGQLAPAVATGPPQSPDATTTPTPPNVQTPAATTVAPQPAAAKPANPPPKKAASKEPPRAPAPAKPAEAAADETASQPSIPASDGTALDAATWPHILDILKKSHNTLYGIARMARPAFDGDKVELYFKFAFHQKRLQEAKNRDIILDAIKQQTGHKANLKCLLEEKDAPAHAPIEASPANPPAAAAPLPVTDPATLATINNIFGPTEALNS